MKSSKIRTRETYSHPWRAARVGFGVIALFGILLGTWGATAPLSGAVIASGSLQVEGRRQSVQHPYGGVIKKIAVREADAVQKGDVLIRLSDVEPRARLQVLLQNQATLAAQRMRLQAERDGRERATFDISALAEVEAEFSKEVIANETQVFKTRNQQHAARLDVIRQQIVQLNEQAKGIESQIEGLNRQAALLAEEMVGLQKLAKTKIASRNEVMALESRQAEAAASIAARRAELASTRAKAGEAQLSITELDRQRVAEATAEIQAIDTKLSELGPKIETARDVLARTEIRAPASGHVVGLKVHTEGGVIETGASLMEIVPSGSPLFVEAKLKLSDVTDVETGQLADIRLSGVPRDLRPKIHGKVRSVSADSLTEQTTGAGYYSLQIELSAHDVSNVKIAMQPGMPVQAIIETQPRTLVQYLVGPLTDEITSAFRER